MFMSVNNNPFLQLMTPLNETFTLTEFSGAEAISQLFGYYATAYSENTAITADQLLLKTATVQINTASNAYYFNGIISRFRAGAITNGLRRYSIEISPSLWQLGFSSDCRIFQNKKITDIVQTLCSSLNIKMDFSGLTGSYKPRAYCVQYRETTLNFIQRILQEEGIFYFFKQEQNQHTLMLADHATVFKSASEASIAFRNDEHYRGHYINYWDRQYNLYSGEFTHTDYNFETPDASLLAKQSAKPKLSAAGQFQLYDYPGHHIDISQGKALAEQHFEALEANHQFIEGSSNYPAFRPGIKFNLINHPSDSENSDYYLTAVNHSAYDYTQLGSCANGSSNQSSHYSNLFGCLPKTVQYRSAKQIPQPIISGHQTATVIGDGQEGQEINVDQYGRIQVHFHWDREQKSSCRVRVAQNWAGQNWGSIFHPRIGQEVVVQFENGNPDRPIVVGSVYNADQMPPYALTDHLTQSGIKTRTSKNGSPAQANELRFEDKIGQEEIYLHAQKDHTRVVENNDTTTINQGDQIIKVVAGSSTLEAAQAIELKVGSNQIVVNTQGIFINGQKIKMNKAG